MRKEHNFFILDIDCLVKLKGLMRYIAEKIHIGQLCLFCDKGFASPQATQNHMVSKSHCFMNMDGFDTEFSEYYDFRKTY